MQSLPSLLTKFRNDLHRLSDATLKFSVNGKGCRPAEVLLEPVAWLSKQLRPSWVTVIAWDIDDSAEPYKHLNYQVNENLEAIFREHKERMFLLTGIPCGLKGYKPKWQDSEVQMLDPFPPFAILKTPFDQVPRPCAKSVVFRLQESPDGSKFAASHPSNTALKKYLDEVLTQMHDLNERLNLTLNLYTAQYPKEPIYNPEVWFTVFLPAVHISQWPFYRTGVLVSFAHIISQDELTRTRKWTEGVCGALGEYLAGAKQPIRHIFGQDKPGVETERISGFYSIARDSRNNRISEELKNDVEVPDFLKANHIPTEIHTLGALGPEQNMSAQAKELCRAVYAEFPNLVVKLRDKLALSLLEAQACTANVLLRQKLSGQLHLLLMLGTALESGWDTVEIRLDDPRALLKNDHNWDLRSYASIPTSLVLKHLVKSPPYPTFRHQAVLPVPDQRLGVEWICDLHLTAPTGPEGRQVFYLDLLKDYIATGKVKHELTWTLMASGALAMANQVVLPFWLLPLWREDGRPDPFSEPVDSYLKRERNRDLKAQCWLILGIERARIVIRSEHPLLGETVESINGR